MKATQSAKYSFSGAVLKYGIPVCNNWKAETVAPSKEKAISNLKYRFKKEANLIPSIPIELVGQIVAV